MPTRGSIRQAVLERDAHQCQYCGLPAVHVDHIIPIALRRRHHLRSDDPETMVAACFACNMRKLTRHLAPPSWADRLHELPGSGWRVWDGNPAALAKVVR